MPIPISDYQYHLLSQKVPMKLLSRIVYAGHPGSAYANEFADTIERLGIEDAPVKPIVTGKYLIEYGMKPSPEMGELLAKLYDWQLQGWVPDALWTYARNACGFSDVTV